MGGNRSPTPGANRHPPPQQTPQTYTHTGLGDPAGAAAAVPVGRRGTRQQDGGPCPAVARVAGPWGISRARRSGAAAADRLVVGPAGTLLASRHRPRRPQLLRSTRLPVFTRGGWALCLVTGRGGGGRPVMVGEALAYAWEHWERVRLMENPAGYLYRVGVSRVRRWRRLPPAFPPPPDGEMPWVEPGLPRALGRLSERQRVAVVLVHCLGWTQNEVAGLLGVSRGSGQTHLERGLQTRRSWSCSGIRRGPARRRWWACARRSRWPSVPWR